MKYVFDQVTCFGGVGDNVGASCVSITAFIIYYADAGVDMQFEVCKEHVKPFMKLLSNCTIEPIEHRLKVMM